MIFFTFVFVSLQINSESTVPHLVVARSTKAMAGRGEGLGLTPGMFLAHRVYRMEILSMLFADVTLLHLYNPITSTISPFEIIYFDVLYTPSVFLWEGSIRLFLRSRWLLLLNLTDIPSMVILSSGESVFRPQGRSRLKIHSLIM